MIRSGAKPVVGAGGVVVLLALWAAAASGAPAVTTVAGTGRSGFSGDGGPAVRARLAGPSGIAVDARGDVAVADTGNCRVRMLAAGTGRRFGIAMVRGRLYTVAGHGCGRRRAGVPSVGAVTGVAFDAAGDLFIADGSGNRVLELPAVSGRDLGTTVRAGRLTSVAGTGSAGSSSPGLLARASRLDDPQGVAVDAAGDLFIAETAACRVVEVPAHDRTTGAATRLAGHLYPVAGTGVCGFGGDGGPATSAELWSPTAVAVDGAGDVLIADEGNSAVREVAAVSGTYFGVPIAAGDIATVAGQDAYSFYLADGLVATGAAAELNFPTGLALDRAGDLLIADSYDQCLRLVAARSGTVFGHPVTAGHMYTVAGVLPVGGGRVPLGDGTRWVLTKVVYPYGVALTPGGDVVFSDQGADTVRRIAAGAPGNL